MSLGFSTEGGSDEICDCSYLQVHRNVSVQASAPQFSLISFITRILSSLTSFCLLWQVCDVGWLGSKDWRLLSEYKRQSRHAFIFHIRIISAHRFYNTPDCSDPFPSPPPIPHTHTLACLSPSCTFPWKCLQHPALHFHLCAFQQFIHVVLSVIYSLTQLLTQISQSSFGMRSERWKNVPEPDVTQWIGYRTSNPKTFTYVNTFCIKGLNCFPWWTGK